MPISLPKFFQRAFAQNGGKQDVPITGDTSLGRASYDEGFPPVTRIPIVAGGIPPFGTDFNGVLYDLSQAIQYVQSGVSFPFDQDFATEIGGYEIGAIVSDASDKTLLWVNGTENNTAFPSGWTSFKRSDPTETVRGAPLLASNVEALAGLNTSKMMTPANKKFADQPVFSGNAVMTSIDNKLVMYGVVTSLLLENGDVVQISAPAIGYSKLHTVESLTGASDVVVNYEHCGARGNGPLKIPDYAGQVTITRIAKWYNASKGLGQDWVNITAFRASNVAYQNTTKRTISVMALMTTTVASTVFLYLNGNSSSGVLLCTSGANLSAAHSHEVYADIACDKIYATMADAGQSRTHWEFR